MRIWLIRNREGVNCIEKGFSCRYDPSGWFFIYSEGDLEERKTVFASFQPFLVKEITSLKEVDT